MDQLHSLCRWIRVVYKDFKLKQNPMEPYDGRIKGYFQDNNQSDSRKNQ